MNRNGINLSLQGIVFKMAVLTITISIGLWCGWKDSYGAFYVAVLVQAINNVYDAAYYLQSGYNKFIVVFQLFAFGGAIISFIIAIIFFTGAEPIGSIYFMVCTVMMLSVPLIHFGIELYIMLRKGNY